MRGFTLFEVLVASALSLVALSLLATLVYTTSRLSLRGQARVDIQQQASLAMEKMVADLMQCSPAGVGALYTPDAAAEAVVLSLHPVVGLSESIPPAQVFDRELRCYWWRPEDGVLRQRVVGEQFHPTLNDLGLAPLNTAQASRGGNQQSLLRMVASPVQGSRLLARGVTALQLYCGADLPLPSGPPQPYQPSARPPSITNPFSVVLHLEREVKGGTALNESGNACEQFRLKRTVWLRDGE